MVAAENPFRASRVEALRFRDGPSIDDLLQRLQDQNGRGALVGPKGHGKTTLLLELTKRLRELGWKAPFIRLSDDWRRCGRSLSEHFEAASALEGLPNDSRASAFRVDSEIEQRVVWFFDGAEQVGFLDWRWVLSRTRHADGLVITTHLPGRLPLLHEARTTPELLRELTVELLESSEEAPPDSLEEECRILWARHRGNLRECLRELYDVWSRRKPRLC